jgi:hypothetical protein
VKEISKSIIQGHDLPPITLVSDKLDGVKVLIEGHSRSIAYCLVDKKYVTDGIPAILGVSSNIADWRYY